jgi:hypothetical protein
MHRFLFDYYLYCHLPYYLPSITTATADVTFFMCLSGHGWLRGLGLFALIYFFLEKSQQNMILKEDSRIAFGHAWGIILSIVWSYYVFVSEEMPTYVDLYVFCHALLIGYTLTMAHLTKPMFLAPFEDKLEHE